MTKRQRLTIGVAEQEILRLRAPEGDKETSVDIAQRRPNHVAIENVK